MLAAQGILVVLVAGVEAVRGAVDLTTILARAFGYPV